jgi:hypothetical protein
VTGRQPEAAQVLDVIGKGGGRPLAPDLRDEMEHRLGANFADVRIHTDARAAQSAAAVAAQAYTVGHEIVFAPGAFTPGSAEGKHRLLHELVHVRQQRAGPVAGFNAGGGVLISDPADPFERAAEATARQPVPEGTRAADGGPAQAATRPTAGAHRAGGPVRLQRYLAGESEVAHGGIEEGALQEAGLTGGEAKLAYYGNWLRDISQLDPGPKWDWLITTLATGMFGRVPTKEELGGYLPSEHLDRPEGGGTPEDPLQQGPNKDRRPISGEQQQWVKQQQTDDFKKRIQAATNLSGLHDWIEVGKEHAKSKLREAVMLGRNARGLEAMGNGLHAVEDYFSHSNFIEVALAQLVDERKLSPGSPSVKAMSHYEGIKDPAHLGKDKFGRPEIVTGTAKPGGNDAVSTWELLKTELTTGELRGTLIKGFAIRYGWQPGGAVGRAVLGTVGGALGAVGGAVGGLALGAGKGAASGWAHAKHWWMKPLAAIGGLFSGAASGVAKGASAGWHAGQQVGGAIGQGAFGAAGTVLAGTVAVAAMTVISPILAAVSAALAKRKTESGTRQSIKEAPAGTGPTHSQIAKDDPGHPLSAASRALAHAADLAIGKEMIQAWAGSGPMEKRADKVAALVDFYVAHPKANGWWEQTLLDAAGASKSPHP